MSTIQEFKLERYLGTWYEIYRLPFFPEKDMVNVTATYSLKPNGKVEVINQGYIDNPDGKFKKIKGAAWQPDPSEPGRLKVRFFWPFSSSYLVIGLDQENYKYALVTTGSGKLLWFLSREPSMPDSVVDQFKAIAQTNGIDFSELIKVEQNWD